MLCIIELILSEAINYQSDFENNLPSLDDLERLQWKNKI